MNELNLVTKRNFNNVACDFYSYENDMFMTRNQVGEALEYDNPVNAIKDIHRRHKDRLSKFSRMEQIALPSGGVQSVYLYSRRGVMEICRNSRQPKANLFMDWVWDITEAYLDGELASKNEIMNEITSLKKNVAQDLQYVKYALSRQIPANKHQSLWKKNTKKKLQLLADYHNTSTMSVLHDIYIELENSYEIDLNYYRNEYCLRMNVDNCSQLEVIERNLDIRKMFDEIVSSLLDKYQLLDFLPQKSKRRTIFDDENVVI